MNIGASNKVYFTSNPLQSLQKLSPQQLSQLAIKTGNRFLAISSKSIPGSAQELKFAPTAFETMVYTLMTKKEYTGAAAKRMYAYLTELATRMYNVRYTSGLRTLVSNLQKVQTLV